MPSSGDAHQLEPTDKIHVKDIRAAIWASSDCVMFVQRAKSNLGSPRNNELMS